MKHLGPQIKGRLVKRAVAVAIAAGLTLAAAGCSQPSGTSSSTGGGAKPTVNIWSWRSQDADLWKQVGDKLGITIDFRAVVATQYNAVLQTAMNGGAGPDVIYTRAGTGTQTYAAAGLISPLDGLVDVSNYNKFSLAAAQFQGKTYGVPFALQTMGLFYNKKILSDNGIDVPKTWDELIAAMTKLKAAGVQPMEVMGTQQWLLTLSFFAIHASWISNDFNQQLVDKKAKLTDKPFVDALAAYAQLSQFFQKNWQAVGAAGNEQETDFGLGNCAFVLDGIFDTPTMLQANPNLDYGMILVPPPAGKTAQVAWYVDGNLALNSNIKDPAVAEAAKKIIQFTATKEFGDMFSGIAGEISPIPGVTIPSSHPNSVAAYNWFQTVPISPTTIIRGPLDLVPVDAGTLNATAAVNTNKGIYAAFQQYVVDLLSGAKTPDQVAAALQNDLAWYFNG